MRGTRQIAVSALFTALALGTLSAAQAAELSIPLDEVRMVTFGKPVSTVYVGNPAIADVTVIDARHVFVLGRAFGGTNLIALGNDGRQVATSHITVYGRGGSTVTVQRGTNAVTYACANSQCRAAPLPGDAQGPFDVVSGQIEKHQSLGMKAAGAQ